jgi:hypothetical protein
MLNEKDHERFNYAIYLDLIAGYSKIAILLKFLMLMGILQILMLRINSRKKLKNYYNTSSEYNISNDISSMISVKTTEVL